MTAKINYNRNVQQWQHATNAKKTSEYWYAIFYQYLRAGKTESEVRRLVEQPNKFWYPSQVSAYNAGMARAVSEVNRINADQKASDARVLSNYQLGINLSGSVVDLNTGQMFVRKTEDASNSEESNTTLYVLVVAAGLLLFMIMRKKKG